MTAVGSVASLHRFPVKSMQGEDLTDVTITADGIEGDRAWALRDGETGKLVSAKRPRLWRAMLDCRAAGTGDDVTVTLPSGETFGITEPGLGVSLRALLGRDVVVERSTHAGQGVYESDWPEIEGITLAGELDFPTNLGGGTTFVDVSPIHLLTSASLTALAAATDATVDLRRFRPSLVIDTPGVSGFAENGWAGRTLRLGEVELLVGDPTPRCVMTTVAQDGLPREPAVLQTIAEHNRVTNVLGTFACLGTYATVTQPGRVSTGDEVELA